MVRMLCLLDVGVANVEQYEAPPTMHGAVITPGIFSVVTMFPTNSFVTSDLLVR